MTLREQAMVSFSWDLQARLLVFNLPDVPWRHINSSHSLHTTVRQLFTIAFDSFHPALNFEFL